MVMPMTASSASTRKACMGSLEAARALAIVTTLKTAPGSPHVALALWLALGDFDRRDLHPRRSCPPRVSFGNGGHHLHPLDHLAEDGVLAVEPGSRHVGDEELAAVGAGAGVGHGQDARAAVLERRVKLVGKGVAGA